MAMYRAGDAVTYLCGGAPRPATVLQDVISGDLDASIEVEGSGQGVQVPIGCITSAGGFSNAAVGDDVFLHRHHQGLLWHGNVSAINDGMATIALDDLAGQTLVLPLSALTQGVLTPRR